MSLGKHDPNDRYCICDGCHSARVEPTRKLLRLLCENPQARLEWERVMELWYERVGRNMIIGAKL